MKKIIWIFLAAAIPLGTFARVRIEKPRSRQATSFAIVIYDCTYDRCGVAVRLYGDAL